MSASAAILLLALSSAHAQTRADLKPKFYFSDPSSTVSVYTDTADQVFQALKQARDYCSGGSSGKTCYTLVNLHPTGTADPDYNPYDIVADGVPYYYWYDQQLCSYASDGSLQGCNTYSDQGGIQSSYTCPTSAPAQMLSDSGPSSVPRIEFIACVPRSTQTAANQPAPDCSSCFGDPIYAANGEIRVADVDYAGAVGLNYRRTYRSGNGSFASPASAAFFDNSQTAGTVGSSCYPSYWTDPHGNKIGYCYPVMSTGALSYQVNTEDGHYIAFSGPNSSVTQSADINERAQRINVSGTTEWQVTREDGSVELYSAGGELECPRFS